MAGAPPRQTASGFPAEGRTDPGYPLPRDPSDVHDHLEIGLSDEAVKKAKATSPPVRKETRQAYAQTKTKGNSGSTHKTSSNHQYTRKRRKSGEPVANGLFPADIRCPCQFGVLPMRSAAFEAPRIPLPKLCNHLMSDDEGDEEDGVDFQFKPKPNCRTEVSFTIEPRRQPPWLTMLNCGFKPMVNCSAPPCFLSPNCNQGMYYQGGMQSVVNNAFGSGMQYCGMANYPTLDQIQRCFPGGQFIYPGQGESSSDSDSSSDDYSSYYYSSSYSYPSTPAPRQADPPNPPPPRKSPPPPPSPRKSPPAPPTLRESPPPPPPLRESPPPPPPLRESPPPPPPPREHPPPPRESPPPPRESPPPPPKKNPTPPPRRVSQ